ncbi:MAG: response regulator transcription factor [Chloroflexota bacterium]|nr:MAG: response regulator transcription factor [Chloroflexota bacterium]
MRILIADGGVSTRFALCTLLGQHPGWKVVAEVASAAKLQSGIEETNPDLVLLDWYLPELHPQQMIAELSVRFPCCAVIVLSGRPETRPHAMACGANGFVSKADPPNHLLDTISSITPRGTTI